jgi:DNA-directed RNA polymerase subunit F
LGEAVEEFMKRMEESQNLLVSLAPGDRRKLETLFAKRRTEVSTKENVLANILDYNPGFFLGKKTLAVIPRPKVLS